MDCINFSNRNAAVSMVSIMFFVLIAGAFAQTTTTVEATTTSTTMPPTTTTTYYTPTTTTTYPGTTATTLPLCGNLGGVCFDENAYTCSGWIDNQAFCTSSQRCCRGTTSLKSTTTTYGTTTTAGTLAPGSSCSQPSQCQSAICQDGKCKVPSGWACGGDYDCANAMKCVNGYCSSTGTTYSGTTYPGTTYPGTTYQSQCTAEQPWNCYNDADCKRVGRNWCNTWCTSGTCPTYTTMTYACMQVLTTAADAAGNCKVFPTPCDIPPGWYKVDRCPEKLPPPTYQPPPDQKLQPAPEGCWYEPDNMGGVRVMCGKETRTCPVPPVDGEARCKQDGGTFNTFIDPSGCKVFECNFGGGGNIFSKAVICPTKDEMDRKVESCKNMGGRTIMKFINGCSAVDCTGTTEEGKCSGRLMPGPEREKCEGSGGKAVEVVDEKGCQTQRCVKGMECPEVPKEAYKKCSGEGGELVVRNNQRGCSEFAKCVKRGSASDIEYESVDAVPDKAVLLKLAFKLEEIKMDMSQLAIKTDALAKYYEEAGNAKEQKRFEKVASMFRGANDKIDEIKEKMSKKISDLTVEDIIEFKHDLKYIKDVVFENVLYVMLSKEGADAVLVEKTSAQVTEAIAKGEVADCGFDGMCFDENLRACNKMTFKPEEGMPIKLSVNGLNEDGACLMKVEIKVAEKTYVAECKYKNYLFGMRGPDDLISTCTGEGVELMKMFASGSKGPSAGGPSVEAGGGGQGPPAGEAGPGGCTTFDECRRYCTKNPMECKKFDEQRRMTATQIERGELMPIQQSVQQVAP